MAPTQEPPTHSNSLLRRGPAWWRGVLAGLLLAASVPPWGWWPLSFIGLALWVELLAEVGPWQRAGLSAIVSATWLGPATIWMVDLTAVGWPLAVAGFAAMHAAAGAVVPSDQRRWVGFPAAFVLAELLRWSWPFGGVPLATMAMAQVSGPMAHTARIGGAALLAGLTAVGGVTLALLLARELRLSLIGVAVLAVTVLAADRAPRASAVTQPDDVASDVSDSVVTQSDDDSSDVSNNGSTDSDDVASDVSDNGSDVNNENVATPTAAMIRVAAVQGGGEQNTRADVCTQRAVFERHIEASRLQITEPVDLIVWPEDVVHLGPPGVAHQTRCPDQRRVTTEEAHDSLSALARDKKAVVIAGFFGRSDAGDANLNYVVAFNPQGEITDEYHKHRLVPFGEYVPLRSWAERFSGELPSRDVRPGPGDEAAVVQTPLGPLGVSISWEVFFHSRARSAIGNGDGQLLLNPTNGSSYWLTVVQSQQVAASRLRAIETDRWVVQAAPTGFSAVIDPDGRVVERSGISESQILLATVQPRHGATLAVRFGAWPVAIIAFLVLAQSASATVLRTKRRPG